MSIVIAGSDRKPAAKLAVKSAAEKARKLYLPSTLYVVECEGFMKIGKAAHMKSRMSSYRCHNPTKTHLVARLDTIDFVSSFAEDFAAKTFRKKLHRGEWFDLNDAEIRLVMSIAEVAHKVTYSSSRSKAFKRFGSISIDSLDVFRSGTPQPKHVWHGRMHTSAAAAMAANKLARGRS